MFVRLDFIIHQNGNKIQRQGNYDTEGYTEAHSERTEGYFEVQFRKSRRNEGRLSTENIRVAYAGRSKTGRKCSLNCKNQW